MTKNNERQPWPDLPESIVEWPSYAVEYLVCLNRIRRAAGGFEDPTASEVIQRTRLWWRRSTAHLWPTMGRRSEANRQGIEPALLTLRQLKARLRASEGMASILAPHGACEALIDALKALGLENLPVVDEAATVGSERPV